MMTVNEVSKKTGVSIRTLHYYDQIGLLTPHEVTESGYRLYDDEDLKRLKDILFFKELEFTLKQIKEIIDNPNYDRQKALKQQINLLNMQKAHLEDLISFALKNCEEEGDYMNFDVFDSSKMEEYAKKAKEEWGQTEAYKEFEEKTKDNTEQENKDLGQYLLSIFVKFGKLMAEGGPASVPESAKAQQMVKELQDFITNNYYTCTNQILNGLGQMYSAEGEMKQNIDKTAGRGTADFVAKAINVYCRLNK
ncbi:MAG: MerR family transcriptional regulator [Clostridia bacterium]|nr:MerR family transcriptional regulator [Clostridia bacterium]